MKVFRINLFLVNVPSPLPRRQETKGFLIFLGGRERGHCKWHRTANSPKLIQAKILSLCSRNNIHSQKNSRESVVAKLKKTK